MKHQWTRCRRCGRTLTDPASIDATYGPECRHAAQGANQARTRREDLTYAIDYVYDHLDGIDECDRQTAYSDTLRVRRRLEDGKRVTPRQEASVKFWRAKLAAPDTRRKWHEDRIKAAQRFASEHPEHVDTYSDADPGL